MTTYPSGKEQKQYHQRPPHMSRVKGAPPGYNFRPREEDMRMMYTISLSLFLSLSLPCLYPIECLLCSLVACRSPTSPFMVSLTPYLFPSHFPVSLMYHLFTHSLIFIPPPKNQALACSGWLLPAMQQISLLHCNLSILVFLAGVQCIIFNFTHEQVG